MKKQNSWEEEWDANPKARRNPKEFIRKLLAQKEEEVKKEIARQLSLTALQGERLENDGKLVDWVGIIRAYIRHELKSEPVIPRRGK